MSYTLAQPAAPERSSPNSVTSAGQSVAARAGQISQRHDRIGAVGHRIERRLRSRRADTRQELQEPEVCDAIAHVLREAQDR